VELETLEEVAVVLAAPLDAALLENPEERLAPY